MYKKKTCNIRLTDYAHEKNSKLHEIPNILQVIIYTCYIIL